MSIPLSITPPTKVMREFEPLCIISLGANLPSKAGSPADTLRRVAADLIGEGGGQLSSLYASEPVGCPPDTPAFINAIAVLPLPAELAGPPLPADAQAFLRHLQGIEAAYGRRREAGTLSRTLDLDLIAYGPLQMQTPTLTLPHPAAHLRGFVLEPLAELLPDYRLPGHRATVAELLRHLPPTHAVRRLPSDSDN